MTVNFQFVDNSPVSVHLPIAGEEEGLPSPPLDEGALFITQTANIQLSEVYGMEWIVITLILGTRNVLTEFCLSHVL